MNHDQQGRPSQALRIIDLAAEAGESQHFLLAEFDGGIDEIEQKAGGFQRIGIGLPVCIERSGRLAIFQKNGALGGCDNVGPVAGVAMRVKQADFADSRHDWAGRRPAPGYFGSRVESSGPDFPLGRRLGPEGLNTVAGSVPTSNSRPTKQLLISSQFCGPHQTCLEGSGLNLLLTELSKW